MQTLHDYDDCAFLIVYAAWYGFKKGLLCGIQRRLRKRIVNG